MILYLCGNLQMYKIRRSYYEEMIKGVMSPFEQNNVVLVISNEVDNCGTCVNLLFNINKFIPWINVFKVMSKFCDFNVFSNELVIAPIHCRLSSKYPMLFCISLHPLNNIICPFKEELGFSMMLYLMSSRRFFPNSWEYLRSKMVPL